jgi:hypothetical protein
MQALTSPWPLSFQPMATAANLSQFLSGGGIYRASSCYVALIGSGDMLRLLVGGLTFNWFGRFIWHILTPGFPSWCGSQPRLASGSVSTWPYNDGLGCGMRDAWDGNVAEFTASPLHLLLIGFVGVVRLPASCLCSLTWCASPVRYNYSAHLEHRALLSSSSTKINYSFAFQADTSKSLYLTYPQATPVVWASGEEHQASSSNLPRHAQP